MIIKCNSHLIENTFKYFISNIDRTKFTTEKIAITCSIHEADHIHLFLDESKNTYKIMVPYILKDLDLCDIIDKGVTIIGFTNLGVFNKIKCELLRISLKYKIDNLIS